MKAKIENVFHCKTPNCIGFCVCEDERLHFYCQTCDKTNCIKCAAIHEEMTCDEYREDLKLKLQNDKNAQIDKAALEVRAPLTLSVVLITVNIDLLFFYSFYFN